MPFGRPFIVALLGLTLLSGCGGTDPTTEDPTPSDSVAQSPSETSAAPSSEATTAAEMNVLACANAGVRLQQFSQEDFADTDISTPEGQARYTELLEEYATILDEGAGNSNGEVQGVFEGGANTIRDTAASFEEAFAAGDAEELLALQESLQSSGESIDRACQAASAELDSP